MYISMYLLVCIMPAQPGQEQRQHWSRMLTQKGIGLMGSPPRQGTAGSCCLREGLPPGMMTMMMVTMMRRMTITNLAGCSIDTKRSALKTQPDKHEYFWSTKIFIKLFNKLSAQLLKKVKISIMSLYLETLRCFSLLSSLPFQKS